jgi:hypothetical protein
MIPKDEGQNVTPAITWSEVPPVDALSALVTLKVWQGMWCTHWAPAVRVSTYLRWARASIDAADAAGDQDSQEKHAVEALNHAKRSLDCLFDLYARREWLQLRLAERPSFSDRLLVLRQRFGNRFPWRLIPRVVAAPRNEAEHGYSSPSVTDAGAAVEAAEAIAAAMPIREMTFGRPAALNLLNNWAGIPGEPSHRFLGFGQPNRGFALCWAGKDSVPRLMVGRVVDNVSADVIWCPLRALTLAQHIELLKWWDASCDQVWAHEFGLRPRIEIAGLDQPRT